MSLAVVDSACRSEHGRLVVVVDGATPSEVLSYTAKQMALKKAETLGYVGGGINGQTGSYPVDAQGRTHEDWNNLVKSGGVGSYRNEFVILGKI